MLRLGAHARNGRPEDVLGEDCPICAEPLNDDRSIHVLHCHHAYHADCIARWLMLHENCPECRAYIPTTPEQLQDRNFIEQRQNMRNNINPANRPLMATFIANLSMNDEGTVTRINRYLNNLPVSYDRRALAESFALSHTSDYTRMMTALGHRVSEGEEHFVFLRIFGDKITNLHHEQKIAQEYAKRGMDPNAPHEEKLRVWVQISQELMQIFADGDDP